MPDPKKILIVSVLKPVDDVRHFRKIARSIASANKYEIFIIGKGYLKNSGQPNVHFLPTGNIGRFSFKRLIISFILLKTALRLKPSVLIINAPELLPMSAFVKKLTKTKVVYDVQENHHKNITYQSEYSGLVKVLFKNGLQIARFFESSVDNFLLAEKIYTQEMSFPKDRILVLENKVSKEDIIPKSLQNKSPQDQLKVLLSGTLSPYTDPVSGIILFHRLTEKFPNASLVVIGKVLNIGYKDKIIRACEGSSKIELLMDLTEIPYTTILQYIHTTDLGIIAYAPDEVNQFRIPTKQFEYAANRIPYLVRKNTYWEEVGIQLGGAIGIDFDHPNLDEVAKALGNQETLFKDTDPINSTWNEEEAALLKLIDSLVN